jgi:hypothetical protein
VLALFAGGDVGNAEVHAAEEAGHEKLIGAELGDQRAPERLRIPRRVVAEAELVQAVRDGGLPGAEVEALRRRALFLGDGL